MSKLNKRLLEKRKRYLEDLITDIESDKKEAERLILKYKNSLDLINKQLENEN
jgi:hypothetical protein